MLQRGNPISQTRVRVSVTGVGVMREEPSFAYSLSQVETGWRWSVYDRDGVTVAGGAHPNRDAAQAAVEQTLRGGEHPHLVASLR